MNNHTVATHVILHIPSYCVAFHVNSTAVNPHNATRNRWKTKC